MTRGDSPVAMTVAVEAVDAALQQVCPKTDEVMVGEPLLALRGFSKFAWLSRLKNSARNCNLNRSVIAKLLSVPKSKFQYEGPLKELRPRLPFCPATGMQSLPPLENVTQSVLGSNVLDSNTTGPMTFGTLNRPVF